MHGPTGPLFSIGLLQSSVSQYENQDFCLSYTNRTQSPLSLSLVVRVK